MKKVVAALVALAMILVMAPAVFAVTESGGFMLEGGTPYEWTAEYTGTATLSGEPAVNIMVNNGSLGMGTSPSFDVTAGTTYTVQHFGDGFAYITWNIDVADSSGSTGGATSGSIDIESYSNAEWTAPQNGTVKFTINISGASLAVLNGYSPLAEGTDSVTAQVTAGTTYGIYPGYDVTTASVVTWEYVTDSGDSGDQGGSSTPVDTVFELGDNAAVLASGDADGETFTFTATESGDLTIALSALAYDQGFGMEPVPSQYIAMAMNSFALQVNSAPVYESTATVAVNAGDVVTVVFACPMMRYATEATFTLSLVPAGGNQGGGAATPDGSSANPYVIDTLPYTINFYGGMDEYYTYTAESDGTIIVTALEGGLLSLPNGEPWDYDANNNYAIPVTAGYELVLNPWTMNPSITGSMVVSYQSSGSQGGGSGVQTPVASGTAEEAPVQFFYTPDADGVLTVTLSGDPGYKIWVYRVADDGTVGLAKEGTAEATYEYPLEAGVEYKVYIVGFYEWTEVDATITYAASFEAEELEVTPVEIEISDVVLTVGEQNVDLLENTIVSLYDFTAPEAGVYTITVPEGVTAGLYGAAWTQYQAAENNALVFTATEANQGFLVGLSSDERSFNVKVEKTDTYTPPAETTYLNYEPTVEFDDAFEMPEGEVISVDITEEQTVVLGNDGYYHLGTYAGPILYINLNSDGFTLATLLSAGAPITMRGEKFTGEDGKLYCYDYMNMMAYGDYYEYAQVGDYYPLNADLMAFFQDYGTAQGWYMEGLSQFSAINAGGANEESAWLVAAVYIEGNNGSATDPEGGNTGNEGGNTGNEGGNTGNENTGNENAGSTENTDGNYQTGDMGIIGSVIALAASAIGGVAVVAKKKEF